MKQKITFNDLILSVDESINKFWFKLHQNTIDILENDELIKDKFQYAVRWNMEHFKRRNESTTLHWHHLEYCIECENDVIDYLIQNKLL